MKSLERNKSYIYFCNKVGETELLDEDGNVTGQFAPAYSSINELLINESAARGTVDIEQFGATLNYSKTLVTNDLTCELNENGVLWLDYGKQSAFSETQSYVVGDIVLHASSLYICETVHSGAWNEAHFRAIPYNYIVVGVAKSINSITYAIRKVEVNG